jgi:sugar/nucleoside kinase (ribokinase family)
MEPYDILIPGNYFCDIIFTGIPTFPALGTEIYTQALRVVPGGVMNSVVAMQRLGVNIGWMGTVGNDFFSRFILELVESEGVDTSLLDRVDVPMQRVTVALSYPHDRAFVTYVDEAPEHYDRIWVALEARQFKHLHFSGLEVDERMPPLIRACHEAGLTVSMDCQHRDVTLDDPLVREIISMLDIFMPNAGEACKLTQTDTLDAAASQLRVLVPTLVIKDGGKGAHAWHADAHHHAPSINITPLDTTGAGDVFNAGFFAAHFMGQDLSTCLRWGNISGGLSTRGYGGCSTAPTLVELQEWLTN